MSFRAHTAPERILIVRLTALGDVIHGVPVLCALREAYPNAFIGWVVEGGAADVLQGHPALDELIRAPRKWYKSAGEVLALRRRLRALRFDTTIDLQCLTKSAALAWMSGAKRRVGVGGVYGREFSKLLNNTLSVVDAEHVIDHYLAIIAPLGIHKPEVRFDLPSVAEDTVFARQLLEAHGLLNGGYAVLNPNAGWSSRIWPAERYGQVAEGLLAERGMTSLAVWAGEAEKAMAEEIVAASGGAAVLAPATTIGQLREVCRHATLFLGSDTGPTHLAVAVGTPTVCLHGATRSERSGAYGPRSLCVQAACDITPRRQRRVGDNAAMRVISVEMAAEACYKLLDQVGGAKDRRQSA